VRFLADHDVYGTTVRFLKGLGHDVLTAQEANLSQREDSELLSAAANQRRILITRDRDYGGLVFATEASACSGTIYLRTLPSIQDAVHAELKRVLELHSEVELLGAFVVVGPGRHRVRKLPR
jgi:predicted nuclease of predicted toxin-antitoxin system